jgi:hypothetical protein
MPQTTKHALYQISLSLEWYVDAIRRFYALGMGTRALTMVGLEVEGIRTQVNILDLIGHDQGLELQNSSFKVNRCHISRIWV